MPGGTEQEEAARHAGSEPAYEAAAVGGTRKERGA